MVKKKSSQAVSETPERIFDEFTELCTLFVGGEEDYFLIPTAVPRLWELMKRVEGDGDLLTMAARTLCLILEKVLEEYSEINRSILKKLRECFQKITSFLTTCGGNELYALPFKKLTPQDLVEELLKCMSVGLKSSTVIDLLPSPHDQLQFCLLASRGSQWITCKALHHCMLMVRVEQLSSSDDIQLLYNLLEEKLEGLSCSAKVDYDWDELLRTVTFCVVSLQTHVHRTPRGKKEVASNDPRLQGGTAASASSSSSMSPITPMGRERKRTQRVIASVEETIPHRRKRREQETDGSRKAWKGPAEEGKADTLRRGGSGKERRVEIHRQTNEDEANASSLLTTTETTRRRSRSNGATYSPVELQIVRKYLHLLHTVGKRCPASRLQLLLACIDAVLVYPFESDVTDTISERMTKVDAEKKDDPRTSTLHVAVLTQLHGILVRESQRHAGFSNPFVKNIGGTRGNDGGTPLLEESTETLILSNLQWALPSITWCALTVLAKLLAACPAMKRDYLWAFCEGGDQYMVYRRKQREALTHAFFSGTPQQVSLRNGLHRVDMLSLTDRIGGWMPFTAAVHFQPIPFLQVFTGAGHPLSVTPSGDAFATHLLTTHEAVADDLQAVLRMLCFGTTPTASLAKAVYLHTVCCSVPHHAEVVHAPFREMIARGAVKELQRVAHRLVEEGRPTADAWHAVLSEAGVWKVIQKAKREEETEEEDDERKRGGQKRNKKDPFTHHPSLDAAELLTAKRHTPLVPSLPYYSDARGNHGSFPSPPLPLPPPSSASASPHPLSLFAFDRCRTPTRVESLREAREPHRPFDSLNKEESGGNGPVMTHLPQGEATNVNPTAASVCFTDTAMGKAIGQGNPTAVRCFLDACGKWGEEGGISVQETAQVLQTLRFHMSKEVEEETTHHHTKKAKREESDTTGGGDGRLSSSSSASSSSLSSVFRSALESYVARLFETVTMEGARRPLIPTVLEFPPFAVCVCREGKEGEVKEKMDSARCPQNHPLYIFHGTEWRCDACQQQTAFGSYACRICNYDICYACLEKSSRCIPVSGTTTIGDVLHSWKQLEQAGGSAPVPSPGKSTAAGGSEKNTTPVSTASRTGSVSSSSSSSKVTTTAVSTASSEIPFALERRRRHQWEEHRTMTTSPLPSNSSSSSSSSHAEDTSGILPLVSPAFLHPSIHIQSTTHACLCRKENEAQGELPVLPPHGKWYACNTLRTEVTPLAMVLHTFGEALFQDRSGGVLLGLYGALEGIATDVALFGVHGIPPSLQDVFCGSQEHLPCHLKREAVHFMAVDCIRYACAALKEDRLRFPDAAMQRVASISGEPQGVSVGSTKAQVPRGDLPNLTAVLWDTLRQAPSVVNTVELKFEGEEGTGNGPTQEVYAEMCRLFQQEKSLWYTQEDGGRSFLCPSHTTVHAKAFFVLGAACARGFVDDYLIELPLLPEVWGLIRYGAAVVVAGSVVQETDESRIPSPAHAQPFVNPTTSMTLLLWKLLSCVDEQLYSSYTLLLSSTPEELEAMDITDTSGRPIRAKEAAQTFVQCRLEAHFQHTLENVRYFQLGLSTTVDLNFFWFFSDQELSEVFCGADNQNSTSSSSSSSATDAARAEKKLFTEDEFRSMVEEAHGYEPGSPIVAQMISIVCHSFSRAEQQYFLEFLTGTSRLPPSGICGLGRKITVVKKDMEGKGEATLPSCSTCFLYLKLPPYSSEEIMRKRLLLAVTEGRRYFSLS